jgi:MFS family permease
MLIGLIGMIVFVASPTTANKLRYGFMHVALIGAGSANPLVAAWLSDNTPDKATRAIFMGFFGWSNLAGVISGQIFKARYAPTYRISIVSQGPRHKANVERQSQCSAGTVLEYCFKVTA